jgi:hypothetical protein
VIQTESQWISRNHFKRSSELPRGLSIRTKKSRSRAARMKSMQPRMHGAPDTQLASEAERTLENHT